MWALNASFCRVTVLCSCFCRSFCCSVRFRCSSSEFLANRTLCVARAQPHLNIFTLLLLPVFPSNGKLLQFLATLVGCFLWQLDTETHLLAGSATRTHTHAHSFPCMNGSQSSLEQSFFFFLSEIMLYSCTNKCPCVSLKENENYCISNRTFAQTMLPAYLPTYELAPFYPDTLVKLMR